MYIVHVVNTRKKKTLTLVPPGFVTVIKMYPSPGEMWLIQSNLVIRNVLIRNKLELRNHFPRPNANLLHKDKELLALRNNFRVTKKFLMTKFDHNTIIALLY